MAQQPQGWHPEDIKAALRKRYGSLAALAKSWGLDRTAIPCVLRDPAHSVPTEMRIALVLGVPAQELWPDRWDAAGEAMPRPNRAHRKPASVTRERSKRRAA